MKIKSLNQDYLKGILDAFIASYNANVRDIPRDFGLEYTIQEGLMKPIGGEEPSKDAVKITFTWATSGEQKLIDAETDSYGTEQVPMDDCFTILLGEDIIKLEEYVNDVLEKVR